MIKESITYVDYDGIERTENFYFNFSKAELTIMDLSETGGLKKRLETIIASLDSAEIVSMFKKIVLDAYGEKSADGRRFVKNDDVRNDFMHTEAFSILFTKLASDAEYATKFINGLMSPVQKRDDQPTIDAISK